MESWLIVGRYHDYTAFSKCLHCLILGTIGDHKNYFDEEMNEIISKWISGNLEKYPLILKNTTKEAVDGTEKCCSLQNTDPTQT